MGTRNITCVYADGEYKVAQYGQFDGYPAGQGVTALYFLREYFDEDKFRQGVINSRFITKERKEEIIEEYKASHNITDKMSHEDVDNFYDEYPQFSSMTAAEILYLIQDNPEGIDLISNLGYASQMCEPVYVYVIDLDTRKFEAYGGDSHRPLTPEDRFHFLTIDDDDPYVYPPKLLYAFDLDNLPEPGEFIKILNEKYKESYGKKYWEDREKAEKLLDKMFERKDAKDT